MEGGPAPRGASGRGRWGGRGYVRRSGARPSRSARSDHGAAAPCGAAGRTSAPRRARVRPRDPGGGTGCGPGLGLRSASVRLRGRAATSVRRAVPCRALPCPARSRGTEPGPSL